MPEPGRAERIDFLRHSIARIEAGGKAGANFCEDTGCIRGSSIAPPVSDIRLPPLPVSFPAPRPARFYEIAPASAADCSAAAGFALSIAGQMVRSLQRPLLWVAEDFALSEQGAPYAPGLAGYGIAISDFILIRTRSRLDLWRVMEEAIKSRAFAAIIGEPAALTGRDLPALIRRLTINARAHKACTMLLRPPARTGFIAPSPLRFEIAASTQEKQQEQLAASVLNRPLPAPPEWSVHYRGAPGGLAGVDPEKPFRARIPPAPISPARIAPAHRSRTHPSRNELLEEVASMIIKERSGAALPVHISRAA